MCRNPLHHLAKTILPNGTLVACEYGGSGRAAQAERSAFYREELRACIISVLSDRGKRHAISAIANSSACAKFLNADTVEIGFQQHIHRLINKDEVRFRSDTDRYLRRELIDIAEVISCPKVLAIHNC